MTLHHHINVVTETIISLWKRMLCVLMRAYNNKKKKKKKKLAFVAYEETQSNRVSDFLDFVRFYVSKGNPSLFAYLLFHI